MSPLFSLIIPHKNTPHLLQRCLDSIPLRQDLQVIVVDDNSDGEVVDFTRFPGLDRDHTEVYFTKEGKGAGYARNVGLMHAKGTWILFADADDYFYTDNLDRLLNLQFPQKYNLIVYGAKYIYVDGSFRWLGYDDNIGVNYDLTTRYDIENICSEFTVPWVKMIRNSFIKTNALNFEEVKYSNDEMFSVNVALLTSSYGFLNVPVYVHQRIKGSLIETFSQEMFVCRINVWFRKTKLLMRNNIKTDRPTWLYYGLNYISYPLFLKYVLKELLFLGWNKTLSDYSVACSEFSISRIPYLTKVKRKLRKTLHAMHL